MKKPKVLIAHPGTQHSIRLAKQLDRIGVLYEFWSPSIIVKNSILFKCIRLLPKSIFKKISNRVVDGISAKKIKTFFRIELKYILKSRKEGLNEDVLYQRNKEFQELIPEASILSADIIIGFDTSSFLLAERAKKHGKIFILDQSIAHPKSKSKVFEKLNLLYPRFSQQLPIKSTFLTDLEKKEHTLSDYIVTASTFTKKTLIENLVEDEKIVINPYGVDHEQFKSPQKKTQKKIKFLFLGSLTVRKGINVLLDIWEELDPQNAELWLAGPAEDIIINYIPKLSSISYLGKIPHAELQNIINSCDILILPSFFEGFGLVILEAMSCGLPVITTEATIGNDIISNNIDGVIYNSFDIEHLKIIISTFIKSPHKAVAMGLKAREKAKEFSWDAYGNRWEDLLYKIAKEKCL